jgi:hypothetical protein
MFPTFARKIGAMRAFEVYLNGKKLCVAGIGEDGVLTTIRLGG